MRSEEFSAKTIEEAVKKALDAFGVTKDKLEYTVITEPTKGFLGIGARHAVIKASLKEEEEQEEKIAIASAHDDEALVCNEQAIPTTVSQVAEIENDAASIGKSFLQQILSDMHLETEIAVSSKDDYLIFDIQGEDLGILIGRRGDTLDALQFLLNLVVNRKTDSKIKVIIDIENYRAKREETLVNLSHKLASKARRTGQKVILEPMNPQERRIIHMALQSDDTVNTYSEGEEPYRKVIIVPKKRQGNKRK